MKLRDDIILILMFHCHPYVSAEKTESKRLTELGQKQFWSLAECFHLFGWVYIRVFIQELLQLIFP